MLSTLSLRMDSQSRVPALWQIVDNLRIAMVEGSLSPGTSLPPVRRLAMELGVHFNTVAGAYRLLAADGWLDLKHGRGAVVAKRNQPAPAAPERLTLYSERIRGLIAQMRAEGIPAAAIAAELNSLAKGVSQCG